MACSSGISDLSSAPPRASERNDGFAAFLDANPFSSIYERVSIVLVLADAWDGGFEAFQARFRSAAYCFVAATTSPDPFARPGIAVERGNADDPRFLRNLASNYGPSLVIDHRAADQAAKLRTFATLYGYLQHGGVYAIGRHDAETQKVGDGLTAGFGRRLRRLTGRAEADILGDGRMETIDTIAIRERHLFVARKPRAPERVRLRPAGTLAATPPRSLGAPPYTRIDPHLIGAPDGLVRAVEDRNGQTVFPPEALVCLYREAVVFGCGLVQVGGAIVEESLINLSRTEPIGALALDGPASGTVEHFLPRPRRVRGRTVLLSQTWQENYGHWLIECLPRLHVVARTHGLAGLKVALYAVPDMRQVYLDSLQAFGIGEDRIVWINGREVVFEELLYPTPITAQPWVKSPLVVEAALAIRDRAMAGRSGKADLSERIYVSRSGSRRRHLVNEAAIVAILAEKGYRVVHPEREAFAEQARIFGAARRVVGAMGAALSNLVFSPDGVKAMMLTNRDMIDDFFLDLASLKRGHYVSIHGTSLQPERGMHADFTIDPDTLRAALDGHDF